MVKEVRGNESDITKVSDLLNQESCREGLPSEMRSKGEKVENEDRWLMNRTWSKTWSSYIGKEQRSSPRAKKERGRSALQLLFGVELRSRKQGIYFIARQSTALSKHTERNNVGK